MKRETRNLIHEKGGRIREVNYQPIKSDGQDGDARIYNMDLYIKTKGSWVKIMSGDKIINQEITRNIDNIVSEGVLQHTSLSGVTANQHHQQVHTIDGSDHTGTLTVAKGGTGVTTLNNLITLGTHTAGNYVATLTAGALIDLQNNSGETASPTVDVDLTEAGEAAIANGDYILFLDGGATGTHAKEAIADVATLFAGTGITATSSVININAAQPTITSIGPAGTLTVNQDLTVTGNFTVSGTTTTINSTTLTIDDKLIELAHSPSGSEGNDSAVDGGGIILKSSDSDKSILWTNSTDSWDLNQGLTVGSTLYVDRASYTGKVGIGTATPTEELSISAANNPTIVLTNTDTTLNNGDCLGSIYFSGLDGTAAGTSNVGAAILGEAAEEWETNTNVNTTPTELTFWTSADDTVAMAQRMIIDKDGDVGIGNTAPGNPLEISTSADDTNLELSGWSTTDAHSAALILSKSASATINTLAATAAGERLGAIEAQGVNTSSARKAAAVIRFEGDAAPDGDSVPGRIVFMTSDLDDAGSPTERMRIDDSGQVGIGTSSPYANLEVEGTAYISVVTNSGGTSNKRRFGYYGDGQTLRMLGLNDSDANQGDIMCWDFDGKVGIGTASPHGTLHVNAATAQIRITDSDSGSGASDGLYLQQNANVSYLINREADKMHLGTSNAEKLTIDASGNVGIGTTAPVTALDIHSAGTEVAAVFGMADDGNAWVSTRTAETQNNYSSYAFMVGSAAVDGVGSANCTAYIMSKVLNSGGILKGDLEFYTNAGDSLGTAKMIIDEAGNVGINTTGPDRKLDVLDASAPQLRLTYDDNAHYTDFRTNQDGSKVWLDITPYHSSKAKWVHFGTVADDIQLGHSDLNTSLFTGSGWGIGEDTNNYSLYIDDLWVRGSMYVWELVINQIRATNGSLVVTSAGKVSAAAYDTGSGNLAADDLVVLTFETGKEGAIDYHPFANNDLIIAHDLELASSGTPTTIREFRLQVMDITEGALNELKAKVITTTATQAITALAGMTFARIGNTSVVTRQGGLYLTSDDASAPFMDIWDNVASFANWDANDKVMVRLGRLDGVSGGTEEYGLIAGDSGFTAASSDSYLKASNAGVELHNIPLNLYAAATKKIGINAGTQGGTDPYIAIMGNSTFPSAIGTGDGVWIAPDQFRVGDVDGEQVVWDGSDLFVKTSNTVFTKHSGSNIEFYDGQVNNPKMTIGAGSIKMFKDNSTTAMAEWNDDVLTLGGPTGNDTDGITISAGGVTCWGSANTNYVNIDSAAVTIRSSAADRVDITNTGMTVISNSVTRLTALDGGVTCYGDNATTYASVTSGGLTVVDDNVQRAYFAGNSVITGGTITLQSDAAGGGNDDRLVIGSASLALYTNDVKQVDINDSGINIGPAAAAGSAVIGNIKLTSAGAVIYGDATNTYASVTSAGLTIYDDGGEKAVFGANTVITGGEILLRGTTGTLGDESLKIENNAISIYTAGARVFFVEGGDIQLGKTDESYMELTSSELRMHDHANNKLVSLTTGTLTLGQLTYARTVMDNTSISLYSGQISGTSYKRVAIDNTGVIAIGGPVDADVGVGTAVDCIRIGGSNAEVLVMHSATEYARLDENGLSIFDGDASNSVATFAATTTIGLAADRVTISSSGIVFREGGVDMMTISGGDISMSGKINIIGSTDNVCIGSWTSGDPDLAEGNVIIGVDAGNALDANTDNVTLIGTEAGKNVVGSTANDTVAIGHQAMYAIAAPEHSTAVGFQAHYQGATSRFNVAIGHKALYGNDSSLWARYNVAVGTGAMEDADGDTDDAGGVFNNTAVGHQAMKDVNGGGQNTAFGHTALRIIEGDYNIGIGVAAGATLTTGSGNVVIGGADPSVITVSDTLTISSGDGDVTWFKGDSTGNIGIGDGYAYRLGVKASHDDYVARFWNDGGNVASSGIIIQAGHDSGSSNETYDETKLIRFNDGDGDVIGYIQGNDADTIADSGYYLYISDMRLKKDIVDTSFQALDTLNKIKLRDFTWKTNGKTTECGLIAQEVNKVFPRAGRITRNEKNTNTGEMMHKDYIDDEYLWTACNETLILPLVKAVQELSAKVTALEAQI